MTSISRTALAIACLALSFAVAAKSDPYANVWAEPDNSSPGKEEFLRAYAAAETKNFAKARDLLAEGLVKDPGSERAHLILGALLSMDRRDNEAAKSFRAGLAVAKTPAIEAELRRRLREVILDIDELPTEAVVSLLNGRGTTKVVMVGNPWEPYSNAFLKRLLQENDLEILLVPASIGGPMDYAQRAILCSADPAATARNLLQNYPPPRQPPAAPCDAEREVARIRKLMTTRTGIPFGTFADGTTWYGSHAHEKFPDFWKQAAAASQAPGAVHGLSRVVSRSSVERSATTVGSTGCGQKAPPPKYRGLKVKRRAEATEDCAPARAELPTRMFFFERITPDDRNDRLVNALNVYAVYGRDERDARTQLFENANQFGKLVPPDCPPTKSWSAVIWEGAEGPRGYGYTRSYATGCGLDSPEKAIRGVIEHCRQKGGCTRASGNQWAIAVGLNDGSTWPLAYQDADYARTGKAASWCELPKPNLRHSDQPATGWITTDSRRPPGQRWVQCPYNSVLVEFLQ